MDTRAAGRICLIGGIVGAGQAAVLLLVSPTVSTDRYSYPFDTNGYVVAQGSFFAQHLLLLVGIVALARMPAVRSSRGARVGMAVGLAGMIGLTLAELVALSAHEALVGSSRADLVDAVYAVVVPLSGLGFVTAGIALLRGSRDPWAGAGWLPALVLAIGVFVFVPMTPALIASYDAARIAIGAWMLLFAALGLGLVEVSRQRGWSPAPGNPSRSRAV